MMAAGLGWLLWPSRAPAALPPATLAALQTADLIYVATRRKDGALSEISPIWFALTDDEKIFFSTAPTSWKARRIAAGSPLYIWVGSTDGPMFEGTAAPVTDAALIDRMGDAYAQKYWIAWLGLFKPRSGRVAEGKTVAFLVTPKPPA